MSSVRAGLMWRKARMWKWAEQQSLLVILSTYCTEQGNDKQWHDVALITANYGSAVRVNILIILCITVLTTTTGLLNCTSDKSFSTISQFDHHNNHTWSLSYACLICQLRDYITRDVTQLPVTNYVTHIWLQFVIPDTRITPTGSGRRLAVGHSHA